MKTSVHRSRILNSKVDSSFPNLLSTAYTLCKSATVLAPRTRLCRFAVALALAVCTLILALVFTPVAQALTYNVLYNFKGGTDGANPYLGTLVQDAQGNLYGTTAYGGDLTCNAPHGCGTVFKVTQSGAETVLWRFTGGADGAFPWSTLFLSGNTLYGTALAGGASYGVVFKVDITTKKETVLWTFTGGGDGGYPAAGPILKSGVLYGTTMCRGSASSNPYNAYCNKGIGYGVLYALDVNTHELVVLHTFDYWDGSSPLSSLTLDNSGNILYGTAVGGGPFGCGNAPPIYVGCGVVFSYNLKTGIYDVLYNFQGGPDGAEPSGALAIDPAGNLYGTTEYSGANLYYGVVFKLNPVTKKETPLYPFKGGTDGGDPYGGVLRSPSGTLYGTTTCGGLGQKSHCSDGKGYGTVFELIPLGGGSYLFRPLHTFDYSDGAYSSSGLIMDAKGNLFGTTDGGGSGACKDGCAVVWEISP